MLQPPGSEDGISAVLLAASNPPKEAKVVWTSSVSSTELSKSRLDEDIVFTHCLRQHPCLQTKHVAQSYPNARIVVVVVVIISSTFVAFVCVRVCVCVQHLYKYKTSLNHHEPSGDSRCLTPVNQMAIPCVSVE